MKVPPQVQNDSSLTAPSRSSTSLIKDTRQRQKVLIGLMMPLMMIVVNMTMFGVALPTIRDQFGIQADTTSWLITAYTLPFMVAMPLYGRLGDGLGKRRLFLLGIFIFLVGTVVIFFAPALWLVILGRSIQGIGASGVNPLCMSIISDRFPADERGKALGTWNSMGPIAGLIGPLAGGFIVDHWGWRMIYLPIFFLALIALWSISRQVPATGRSFIKPEFFRNFDWGGVIFLALAAITMVFYLSSRPITGVEPLHDWRLLAATLIFSGVFVVWERHQADPFVDFGIFKYLNFVRASLGSGIRMFVMGSLGFLLPLYLTDIYGLTASAVGMVTMVHAISLLIPMRFGGHLADRWSSRGPVLIGVSVQIVAIVCFTQLSVNSPVWMAVIFLALHGLGAGLYLAPLHRAALNKIAPEQSGIAAGLYGMIRFSGMVLGAVLGGVILQFGLNQTWPTIQAFQMVFWFVAGVALLGLVVGAGLRD